VTDLRVLAWPLLASEPSTSGAGLPLLPALCSAKPVTPVVLADGPAWKVVVTRRPGFTVAETIIPDTDPETPRTFDESHTEEANELGRFSFSVFDGDGFDIEVGDLVEFYDRGLCIGGGVIRAREVEKVSKSREGKQVVKFAGVRPLGILQEAPVLPSRGLGSIAQDRIWGWVGVTYDDSTWIPATLIVRLDGTSRYWTDALEGFEDRTAYWLWASRRVGNPPLDEWSPFGWCLFRQTFSVPADVSDVEIEWSADAQAELYVEGELIGVTDFANGTPTDVRRRQVSVRPGSEVLIAVAAVNNLSPGDEGGAKVTNPGGVVWSVAAVEPDGTRTVLAHSDASVVMLEYPNGRPGVTPGQVLLEVLAEAQGYGWATGVTATFTDEVDSAGRPWAEVGEIATKVGYDEWKFLSQLVAVYVDTDLTPGTWEWNAWSKGTRGRSSGVELVPSDGDPENGNLQEHTVTETLMRGNDNLTFSQFGWQLHRSGEGGFRVAATLGLGALPSSIEVDRWAQAELAESSVNRVEHDVSILPVGDSDKPYWSYGIGDTILIDGSPEVVQSISWRRDRNGVIWWDEDEA
jgi:hypothetical protein